MDWQRINEREWAIKVGEFALTTYPITAVVWRWEVRRGRQLLRAGTERNLIRAQAVAESLVSRTAA